VLILRATAPKTRKARRRHTRRIHARRRALPSCLTVTTAGWQCGAARTESFLRHGGESCSASTVAAHVLQLFYAHYHCIASHIPPALTHVATNPPAPTHAYSSLSAVSHTAQALWPRLSCLSIKSHALDVHCMSLRTRLRAHYAHKLSFAHTHPSAHANSTRDRTLARTDNFRSPIRPRQLYSRSHPRTHRQLSRKEKMTMSPLSKWRKYRRFPWELTTHVLVVAIAVSYVVLHNLECVPTAFHPH
jgi:hypothetical protein